MANYRQFVTNSGLAVFAGKNAENNDELVLDAKPKDKILHTLEPGSPFVNLGESPSKKDIKEASVFCAKYSQSWRDNKRDVIVSMFVRSYMNKRKRDKAGSWNVKHKEVIKVKKSDILKFEKEMENGKTG